MVRLRQRVASATLNTKPSARPRRSAECGRRSVIGTEACGFVRRRLAVRTPSGCAAPTGTNAARGADTNTRTVLRRSTKWLRAFSRSLDSVLSQEFAQRRRARRGSSYSPTLHEAADMEIRLSVESLTRSHGGPEFLHDVRIGVSTADCHQSFSVAPCLRVRHHLSRKGTHVSMKCRCGGESLFVNRRVGERFLCRTFGARSCRHRRANPKGEGSRAAAGDAVGIRPDGVCVASIARRAISRRWRFVFARSAEPRERVLTQRTRRGRDAKVRKGLCLVAVNSLCDLCVKTFAFFALKECTLTQRRRGRRAFGVANAHGATEARSVPTSLRASVPPCEKFMNT